MIKGIATTHVIEFFGRLGQYCSVARFGCDTDTLLLLWMLPLNYAPGLYCPSPLHSLGKGLLLIEYDWVRPVRDSQKGIY